MFSSLFMPVSRGVGSFPLPGTELFSKHTILQSDLFTADYYKVLELHLSLTFYAFNVSVLIIHWSVQSVSVRASFLSIKLICLILVLHV